jgi:hypothetical protein
MPRKKTTKKKGGKNSAASYNRYKIFEGHQYTGMSIGRTHHWYYDKSDWKEKKVTPEKWEFTYSTTKRRAGKAPEGSGAPVGTGYHWFILAHQYVDKLNADDYSTQMVGLKYKLAHKRAATGKWSASGASQNKKLIQILKELIVDLEKEPEQLTPIELNFEHKGKSYVGTGVPILTACDEGACQRFDITLNDKHIGVLRHTGNQWKLSEIKNQSMINALGSQIENWYTS